MKKKYSYILIFTLIICFVLIKIININKPIISVKGTEAKIEYTNNFGVKENYNSILYKSQHYLKIEDFINIVNEINQASEMINDLKLTNYNEKNNTLSIVYNKINHSFMAGMQSEFYNKLYTLTSLTSSGEDLTVNLDLNTNILHSVKYNDEIYLPIQLINYKIFNDSIKILKTDENIYIYKDNEIMDSNKNSLYSPKIVSFDDNYSRSLELLSNFFLSTGAYEVKTNVEEVSSYTQYIIALFQLSNQLQDYHYAINFDKDKFNIKELSYDEKKIVTDSYYIKNTLDKKTATDAEKNIIQWKALNANTLYIDSNSFLLNKLLYNLELKNLTKELESSEYETLVLDLRDNHGGNLSNAFSLFTEISNNEFTVNIAQAHNNQIFSTHKLNYKKNLESEKKYDYIIIINEYTESSAIIIANLLKDNNQVQIIGQEPHVKQTGFISLIQTLDGTLLYKSQRNFIYLTNDGLRFDDISLLDDKMTNEEIRLLIQQIEKSD